MNLHVILRSNAAENRKHRPAGYAKHIALASFIRSLVEADHPIDIVYLNDGDIPEDRAQLMRGTGELVSLPPPAPLADSGRVRLVRSYFSAIELALNRGWADDDVVYVGEDDWLFRPNAFRQLISAVQNVEFAEYFAFFGTILEHESDVRYVDDCIWQIAHSTTSSFAVRIGTLRKDRALHRMGLVAAHDTNICLVLRGVRPFRWSYVIGDFVRNGPGQQLSLKRRLGAAARETWMNAFAIRRSFGRHLLAVPYEPLAMHWEVPYRGHRPDLVDWGAVAADTRSWLESSFRPPCPRRTAS